MIPDQNLLPSFDDEGLQSTDQLLNQPGVFAVDLPSFNLLQPITQ